MNTSDALKIVERLAVRELDFYGNSWTCAFCTPVFNENDVPCHADSCLIMEARRYMQWITKGTWQVEQNANSN